MKEKGKNRRDMMMVKWERGFEENPKAFAGDFNGEEREKKKAEH